MVSGRDSWSIIPSLNGTWDAEKSISRAVLDGMRPGTVSFRVKSAKIAAGYERLLQIKIQYVTLIEIIMEIISRLISVIIGQILVVLAGYMVRADGIMPPLPSSHADSMNICPIRTLV
jgi:hypothetical protein